MEQKRKIHILYEHLWDMNPFGTSQIRLIRPLSHPKILEHFQMSMGPEYYGQDVDAVILDRLWRPDISINLAKSLLNDIHRKKAKFIYAIDDNLLDLPNIPAEKKDVIKYFLINADQVWVTTPFLQEKFRDLSRNIEIIPNCLDERLINLQNNFPYKNLGDDMPITIGYMGTPTHLDDFMMILPALKRIFNSQPNVKLQIIGITNDKELYSSLSALPIEFINTPIEMVPYENFLPWFANNFKWDIGLAPLMDTQFTRCKSDIKFLDYCMLPTATICSNVPAYQAIKHLETGLVVKNEMNEWQNAIDLLIWNSHLRAQLTSNSRNYLINHRTIGINYENWLEKLCSLLCN